MKYIICLSLFLLPLLSLAQTHILKQEYHGMRENDSIVKVQVEFIMPGESGENVIWDFSEAYMLEEPYPVYYYLNDDSLLVGREHWTNYKYRNEADSLIREGYSNPTTFFNYIDSELLLTYPFAYTDSLMDYFYGEGNYGGKMHFRSAGKTTTKADAFGAIILPSPDTLTHVLRTHTQKVFTEKMSAADTILYRVNHDSTLWMPSSIEQSLEQDSVTLHLDTYQWYARGYRYPVFETIFSRIQKHGNVERYFATSFFYPPSGQSFLEEDPVNMVLQQEVLLSEMRQGKKLADSYYKKKKEGESSLFDSSGFSYIVHSNPIEDILRFTVSIAEEANVSIGLFGVDGRMIKSVVHGKVATGEYTHEINMDSYRNGEYVLMFLVDNHNLSKKIIKK